MASHGAFSRIDHILGHKERRGKLKNTEITSSIFFEHIVQKRANGSKKNYSLETRGMEITIT